MICILESFATIGEKIICCKRICNVICVWVKVVMFILLENADIDISNEVMSSYCSIIMTQRLFFVKKSRTNGSK